jgi:hypothetical protein
MPIYEKKILGGPMGNTAGQDPENISLEQKTQIKDL